MTNTKKNKPQDVSTPIETPTETNPESKALAEPPHSCKVMWVKGVVRVTVTLHRIPDNLMNFSPSADRFHLDTLKHTKKYVLDFPYPYGIKVEATNPEATLDAGILKTDLRITDWGSAISQRKAILSSHVDMLQKRGIKVDVSKFGTSRSSKIGPGNEGEMGKAENTKHEDKKQEKKQEKKQKKKNKKQKQGEGTSAGNGTEQGNAASSEPKPQKKKKFLEKLELENLVGQIAASAETKSQSDLQKDQDNADRLDQVVQLFQNKQAKRKQRKEVARQVLREDLKLQAKKRKILEGGSGDGDGGGRVKFAEPKVQFVLPDD